MTSHLTINEVATRLHCSSRQVLRLIDAGRLKAIDTGLGTRRKLVVAMSEIEQFESDNQTKARSKPKPKPKITRRYMTEAKIERARQQLSAGNRQ